jgi:hypothetical protein
VHLTSWRLKDLETLNGHNRLLVGEAPTYLSAESNIVLHGDILGKLEWAHYFRYRCVCAADVQIWASKF